MTGEPPRTSARPGVPTGRELAGRVPGCEPGAASVRDSGAEDQRGTWGGEFGSGVWAGWAGRLRKTRVTEETEVQVGRHGGCRPLAVPPSHLSALVERSLPSPRGPHQRGLRLSHAHGPWPLLWHSVHIRKSPTPPCPARPGTCSASCPCSEHGARLVLLSERR